MVSNRNCVVVDSHSILLKYARKTSNTSGPNSMKHSKAAPLSTIDNDNDDLMSAISGWYVAIVTCMCRRYAGFVVVAKMPGVLSGMGKLSPSSAREAVIAEVTKHGGT